MAMAIGAIGAPKLGGFGSRVVIRFGHFGRPQVDTTTGQIWGNSEFRLRDEHNEYTWLRCIKDLPIDPGPGN